MEVIMKTKLLIFKSLACFMVLFAIIAVSGCRCSRQYEWSPALTVYDGYLPDYPGKKIGAAYTKLDRNTEWRNWYKSGDTCQVQAHLILSKSKTKKLLEFIEYKHQIKKGFSNIHLKNTLKMLEAKYRSGCEILVCFDMSNNGTRFIQSSVQMRAKNAVHYCKMPISNWNEFVFDYY